MAGRKQRDKFGRYKGKGGIKPYKSNLKGKKRKSPPGQVAPGRKGMSKKKKVAIVAGVALGIAANRQMNKKGVKISTTGKIAIAGVATGAYLRSRKPKKRKAKK